MVRRLEYDVAVVGASAAGCSAAMLLGRAGLSVGLLERYPDPSTYKKLCTHYIQPSAIPSMRRLGLEGAIEEAGGVRNGLEFWTRWGRITDPGRAGEPPETHGYNIRRQKLDPLLRTMAAATPGVHLMLGHSARSLLESEGRIRGVGAETSDGERVEIRARLVVAADGRHSRVAELAGVRAFGWRRHSRSGYCAYFENVSLPSGTNSQVWLLEPDFAYAFRTDDGLGLLAYVCRKDRVGEFKKDIRGKLIDSLRRLPCPPLFDPDDQASEIRGLLTYPNVWRMAPPPGLAFVGDAAVTVDYVFGLGLGWAFQTAEWLADLTVAHWGTDGGLERAVRRHRRRLRSNLLADWLHAADFSTARGLYAVERILISAACRDSSANRHFLNWVARNIPVTRLIAPSALVRATRVNVSHARRRRRGTARDGVERSVDPPPGSDEDRHATVTPQGIAIGGKEEP